MQRVGFAVFIFHRYSVSYLMRLYQILGLREMRVACGAQASAQLRGHTRCSQASMPQRPLQDIHPPFLNIRCLSTVCSSMPPLQSTSLSGRVGLPPGAAAHAAPVDDATDDTHTSSDELSDDGYSPTYVPRESGVTDGTFPAQMRCAVLRRSARPPAMRPAC